MTPRWPLTPLVQVTCVTLPKDHCIQVPWKYVKVCGYSDPFFKNLNRRSLTPTWPLTPILMRSHVWLYPKIIVSKSHENTSKYVDTLTHFSKTWSKGHWPLDDLWPHICWGHMFDSTQRSLCSSPMGRHQCMWIQWSILQNYHILYIYIHTTYRMSDHIVSFWTKFRCDKNKKKQKTKTKQKQKLHKPIVRTLATCHPRANVVCVETLLKFVLIPLKDASLTVDLTVRGSWFHKGTIWLKKRSPVRFCFAAFEN